MNKVLEILSELKNSGISLVLDDTGHNLKLRGELSELTVAQKNKIKAHKEDLVLFIKTNSAKSNLQIPVSDKNSKLFPLAPNQKGIWFHEKIEDLGIAYIIPSLYFYQLQNFNETYFLEALNHLVINYDVFRLIFTESKDIPYQSVKEKIDIKRHCQFKKVSSFEELQSRISIKNDQLFSPLSDPVWDLTVYELPDTNFCFYLRFHHLIGDGESLNLFIEKLINGYIQLVNGQPIAVNSNLNYHDYVAWILDKSNFEDSSLFWKQEFLNYEENFQLLTDKINTAHLEGIGNTFIYEFSSSVSANLRHWSIAKRVSLASLLTAAVGIVLSKRGNSDDFVVGIPTASRNHPQLTDVIGNLVNTLPLRLKINYSLDQEAYIREIQNRYVAVLNHQIYPFEYILEDINYQRVSNQRPLFNVMVSVSNTKVGKLTDQQIDVSKNTSLYDLTFTFLENDENIILGLEYVRSKFDEKTIENIAKEIECVFEQLTAEVPQQLAHVYLTEQKLDKPQSFPQKDSEFKSVLDRLVDLVSLSPLQKGIISGDRTLNYLQFQELVVDLATYLIVQKGTAQNSRVVVRMEKSIEQLVSMYAIWLAGGIYVPIDLTLPKERERLILEDCEPDLVIDAAFLVAYQLEEKVASSSVQFPEISRDLIAYLLYTSGTTGKPKGVMITHGNLACKMEEEAVLLSISEQSITYALTNSSFDVSFLESVLPLSNGGTVVIAQEDELKDTERSINSIIQHGVTHLQGTPTYFSHFVSLLTEEISENLNCSLQIISIGGESLNAHLVKQIKSKLPSVKINNHYGPTEITIDALVKEDILTFTSNSIGRPFGNTKAFVVDEFGNILPSGVVGELVIGGPSVFRGYWNDEDLTKSKLTQLSFSDGLFYRTGDLAKVNSEDEFEFIGRNDKQIKLRGYRIELDDVNQSLLSIKGVHQAVSRIVETVLVSWVVSEVEEEALMEQLRMLLPHYMVPQSILIVASFPTNENGKIALNQLPKPLYLEKELLAPQTEIQSKIADIWKEVLRLDEISVDDNFFELGAHSLKITQLKNRYQKCFGVEISIKELFLNATLFSHSELIENYSTEDRGNIIVPIPKAEDYPVSYSQHRMWILSQLDGGSRAYHMPTSMRLKGKLNIEIFLKSIEHVIDKHESLRTIFHSNDAGELRQRIMSREQLNFKIDLNDIRDLDNQSNLIEEFISERTETLFDLSKGPLVRVGLLILNPEEFVFYYNLHHIICDGWSMEVITKEVLSIYTSLLKNENVELKLPFQYKDYTLWQLDQIRNEPGLRAKEYWLKQFSGELSLLNLVNQKLRPAVKSYNGNSVGFSFSVELSSKLLNFCKNEGGTLFMGLLAGLNGVLHRYTNQEDIVIGTPIAGRTTVELENQIGLYVNTLAIRSQFSRKDSFSDLFRKVRETVIGAYDHQLYPFDKLVNELDLPRDLSRNPLFDVMLVMQTTAEEQNHSNNQLTNDFVEVVFENASASTSHFDISFTFLKVNGQLIGTANYNTDIYTFEFVNQLTRHFEAFLEVSIELSSVPVGEVSFMKSEELLELTSTSHGKHIDRPKGNTIVSLFEEQVEKSSGEIAVVYGSNKLTYLELSERSTYLAHYLHSKYSISADDLFAVKLDRNEKLIVSILGILKAGAAYVPIHINNPEERTDYMLRDTNSKVLIDADFYADFENEIKTYADAKLNIEIKPEHIAYAIFTSGTTGAPKGVLIEHKSILNTFHCYAELSKSQSRERISLTCNYNFDVSVLEIFNALLTGSELHIPNEQTVVSPFEYANFILENEINHCYIHPTHLKDMGDIFVEKKYNKLNRILIGVEQIQYNAIQFYLKNGVQVINGYGPTENAVCSTFFEVDDNEGNNAIPIGFALKNTQLFILNDALLPQPIGAIGRIYLAGDGLARAYLNDPELTQRKFVKNPFMSGQRMYDTGDLARWMPDGNIDFLGRDDSQVKIRGFRIELGEIENAISEYSAEIDRVVVQISGEDHEKRLVAFIVGEDVINPSELRAFLKTKVPHYMVPSFFYPLTNLPLTPNGKIDKKELSMLVLKDLDSESDYVSPESEMEITLVGIWEDVLKRDHIGVDDDFFEIGGHSINAVHMANRISKDLSRKVSIKDIFLHSVLRDLAIFLNEKETTQFFDIKPVEKRDYYPTSSIQKRLYITELLESSVAYNISGAYRIAGPLDKKRLHEVFNKIINRHESLRTYFKIIEDEIVQCIDENTQFSLIEFFAENSEQEQAIIADFIKPFNLNEPPLIRIGLINVAEDEFILLFDMHHIISDGESMTILVNDFVSLYNGVVLSPMTIQYKDFIIWHLNKRERQGIDQDKAYWVNKLKGDYEIASFKLDYKRPDRIDVNGGTIHFTFENELSNSIRRLSNETRTSPYIVLATAFKILLYKSSNQENVLIATDIAGRGHQSLEKVIGMFVNSVVLKTIVSSTKTGLELISDVKENMLESMEHQNYHFEEILDALDKKRELNRNPLFDIMFSMMTKSYEGLAIDDLKIEPYGTNLDTSAFDMMWMIMDEDTRITLSISYQNKLFKEETIHILFQKYVRVLNQIVDSQNESIESYSIDLQDGNEIDDAFNFDF